MSAAGPTPTIELPSIATAPGLKMFLAASTVTTVPPDTIIDTCRGAFWAAVATTKPATAINANDHFTRMSRILWDLRYLAPPAPLAPLAPRSLRYSSPSMAVHVVHHPLVHDALSQLRDVNTETEQFRSLANRISVLLVAEALRELPTERAVSQTPLEKADGRRVARDVVVVPVLRAGLGMLDAVLELLPSARVGHIGLQRDESTAVASQYYAKLPA